MWQHLIVSWWLWLFSLVWRAFMEMPYLFQVVSRPLLRVWRFIGSADWKGLVVLGAFFFSSILLSKWKSKVKEPSEERLAKGSRRDWRQVLANGGPAVLFLIIYHFERDIQWLWAFIAAIAAANADTWASEIGIVGKKKPISVKTWKQVEKGVSGAVSLVGTAGAVGGAAWIAVIAYLLYLPSLLSVIGFAAKRLFRKCNRYVFGCLFPERIWMSELRGSY